MYKKLIFKFVKPILKLYYFIKYKDIWSIKRQLNKKKRPNKVLLAIYDDYFNENGSWIGYNSKFTGIPCFPHGPMGVFISGGSKIGKNVIIFQHVTIGSNTLNDSHKTGSPTIGDNVYIGSGAKIVGGITIGNNSRIGANAVVYNDMLPNSVAVQSPTRIIQKDNLDNRYYTFHHPSWVYFDNGDWIEDKLKNI